MMSPLLVGLTTYDTTNMSGGLHEHASHPLTLIVVLLDDAVETLLSSGTL